MILDSKTNYNTIFVIEAPRHFPHDPAARFLGQAGILLHRGNIALDGADLVLDDLLPQLAIRLGILGGLRRLSAQIVQLLAEIRELLIPRFRHASSVFSCMFFNACPGCQSTAANIAYLPAFVKNQCFF